MLLTYLFNQSTVVISSSITLLFLCFFLFLLIFCCFFFFFFFFFFQAEDGIRDKLVTGVQTCALPIFSRYDNDAQPSPPLAGCASRPAIATSPPAAPAVRRLRWPLRRRPRGQIGRASCRERV